MSAEVYATVSLARLAAAGMLLALAGGCFGGKGGPSGVTQPPPTPNVATITVDSGPTGATGATGAINRPYVTVHVCAAGSSTQCADIDHVVVDTGSWGLRLIRSSLMAAKVTLGPETDAQGNTIEECTTFASGEAWGPVALADVTIAGEKAAKIPVQVLDDTQAGAPAPASCGSSGLINGVADWAANGVLGIGVFAQDCGPACDGSGAPLPVYYGCSASGACAAENIAVTAQVANPVWAFATDNNGVIVSMANLQSANGDSSAQGELIFGLGTQSDNLLPATGLVLLGVDSNGDFQTTYNGANASLPGLIDSGTDSYLFDDPAIPVCTSAAWVGYYCPVTEPLVRTAVNASAAQTAASVGGASSSITFAIANPDNFVANATAYGGLAGGAGVTRFTWGMPFFYGRSVYVGFDEADGLRAVPLTRAIDLSQHPAICAHEHGERQPRRAEESLHLQLMIEELAQCRARRPQPAQSQTWVVIGRDTDDTERGAAAVPRQAFQRIHLGAAGAAPARPHVDDQRTAAKSGELLRRSVQSVEPDVRQYGAHSHLADGGSRGAARKRNQQQPQPADADHRSWLSLLPRRL